MQLRIPHQDVDIDFVIMWVDGSDPFFATEHAKAVAAEGAGGIATADAPNRHRDNGELLFLLRAIRAHMGWYRRIYIVTNGQRPSYLSFASDSIRLVTHQEIFPTDLATPSFNTYAIESCIHEIDGLSETFVRFSDDFFVGRDISKKVFLGVDGLGHNPVNSIVFNQPPDAYFKTLQNCAIRFFNEFGYMPLRNTLHAPQLRRRSIMRQMVDRWPEWYRQTRSNRFRTTDDAVSMFLYPYFSLFHHRRQDLDQLGKRREAPSILNLHRRADQQEVFSQVLVGAANHDWRAKLRRMAGRPPFFFNVNDEMGPRANPKDLAYVGERLSRMFPSPSPFETDTDALPGYASVIAMRPDGEGRPTRTPSEERAAGG